MSQSPILLSRSQLALRWRKSPRRVKAWTEAGLIPHFTDPESGRVLYPLASIVLWEQSHADHKAAS